MATRRLAPAKINLALHVTGQREDGYHLLDSLVCFADIGDFLTLEGGDETRLSVTGPMAPGVPTGAGNLVMRAVQVFAGDWNGLIGLEKHLPAAAGIGGGSADAAACIIMLSEMLGRDLPEAEVLLSLGADVPVCAIGQTARMSGIGEVVDPVEMPRFSALLVNPGVSVSTPDIFARLRHRENTPLGDFPDTANGGGWIKYLQHQRNDLEGPAAELVPEISDVLDAIRRVETCQMARMSGSGATCFGLFLCDDDAKSATEVIRRNNPGWWVKACRVG